MSIRTRPDARGVRRAGIRRASSILRPVILQPITLLAAYLGLAGGLSAQTMQMQLAPSSSTKINVPDGVKKIFISNPSIIDAQPADDGYAVLVTGQRHGRAELRITRLTQGEMVYSIEVQPELQDLANEVREVLSDVEGLEINVVGEKVVLTGKLLSKTDLETVEQTANAFAGRVVAMVELDKNVNELIKRALEKEINLDTVELILEGDTLTAMGSVPSEKELERVKSILKRRHDNVVLMLMVVE